jgi:hypothetical protein
MKTNKSHGIFSVPSVLEFWSPTVRFLTRLPDKLEHPVETFPGFVVLA